MAPTKVTVKVRNLYGEACELDVVENDATLLRGRRAIEHGALVGGWHWEMLTDRGRGLVSGTCYACGILELRGFGWLSMRCIRPNQCHLWQRPL